MMKVKEIIIGTSIFMVETSTVLEFEIIDFLVADDIHRLKLKGDDLTFEVDFNDVFKNIYFDKNEALTVAIKCIRDSVNTLVRELSNNEVIDYIELDRELEKYKELFPEHFV